MDAVASVYRFATSMSAGIEGVRSHVEFHRRGASDATLHDGRSIGVVRQGLAMRCRSFYDWLRTVAQYVDSRRPGTVLILVPIVWELRRMARLSISNDLCNGYVDVESRNGLEQRDRRLWCEPTWLFGLTHCTLKTVSVPRRSVCGRQCSAQGARFGLRPPSVSARLRSGRLT